MSTWDQIIKRLENKIDSLNRYHGTGEIDSITLAQTTTDLEVALAYIRADQIKAGPAGQAAQEPAKAANQDEKG